MSGVDSQSRSASRLSPLSALRVLTRFRVRGLPRRFHSDSSSVGRESPSPQRPYGLDKWRMRLRLPGWSGCPSRFPLTTDLCYGERVLFFVGFLVAIGHGLFGPQVEAENFATVFVWAVWIKGVGILSILLGNPWRVLSPWQALYKGLSRLKDVRLLSSVRIHRGLVRGPLLSGSSSVLEFSRT